MNYDPNFYANFPGPITGKTGPSAPPTQGTLPGQGGLAWADPPPLPYDQMPGPRAYQGPPRVLRWIEPLAVLNDASQFANILSFVRPMPWQQAGNSNPPAPTQPGPSSPPVTSNQIAAGERNIQLQLGNLAIQAANLQAQNSNYFGS